MVGSPQMHTLGIWDLRRKSLPLARLNVCQQLHSFALRFNLVIGKQGDQIN